MGIASKHLELLWKDHFLQVLNKGNANEVAVVMPEGSRRRGQLAPTCTSLPGHVLFAESALINCAHRLLTLITVDIITRSFLLLLCLSKDGQGSSGRKQSYCSVYTPGFSEFSSPWREVSRRWAIALGCRVRHLAGRRARLSARLGSQPVIWGEIRAVWDFKRRGANERSCQSVPFEVLTAMSANNHRILGWGLFDVETSGKGNVKDVFWSILHIQTHIWEGIVRVYTVSELVKMKKW